MWGRVVWFEEESSVRFAGKRMTHITSKIVPLVPYCRGHKHLAIYGEFCKISVKISQKAFIQAKDLAFASETTRSALQHHPLQGAYVPGSVQRFASEANINLTLDLFEKLTK